MGRTSKKVTLNNLHLFMGTTRDWRFCGDYRGITVKSVARGLCVPYRQLRKVLRKRRWNDNFYQTMYGLK